MVYKFRLWFEDDDDVTRTFEVKPSNTFASFHIAIQNAIGFDGSFKGQFMVSDDAWRRKKTIADLEKTPIKNAVFEPYQKFIYLADEEQDWTLFCEMIGFGEAKPNKEYPELIKSEGTAPKQRPTAIVEEEETADMDDLAAMLMKNALNAMDGEGVDEGQDTDDEEPGKEDIFDEEYGTNEDDLDGFGEPSDM